MNPPTDGGLPQAQGGLPPGHPVRGPGGGPREGGQEGLQAPRALHGVHAAGTQSNRKVLT